MKLDVYTVRSADVNMFWPACMESTKTLSMKLSPSRKFQTLRSHRYCVAVSQNIASNVCQLVWCNGFVSIVNRTTSELWNAPKFICHSEPVFHFTFNAHSLEFRAIFGSYFYDLGKLTFLHKFTCHVTSSHTCEHLDLYNGMFFNDRYSHDTWKEVIYLKKMIQIIVWL